MPRLVAASIALMLSLAAMVLKFGVDVSQWGHVKRETMPTDGCQFFYECEGCKALLRPQPADCCVPSRS